MREIYKLRFPDGKSYIGQAKNCAGKRYFVHKSTADSGLTFTPLYRHWHKFGPPELIILQENVPLEELDACEKSSINRNKTMYPNGLNAMFGRQIDRKAIRLRKSERIAENAKPTTAAINAARKQAYLDRHG